MVIFGWVSIPPTPPARYPRARRGATAPLRRAEFVFSVAIYSSAEYHNGGFVSRPKIRQMCAGRMVAAAFFFYALSLCVFCCPPGLFRANCTRSRRRRRCRRRRRRRDFYFCVKKWCAVCLAFLCSRSPQVCGRLSQHAVLLTRQLSLFLFLSGEHILTLERKQHIVVQFAHGRPRHTERASGVA